MPVGEHDDEIGPGAQLGRLGQPGPHVRPSAAEKLDVAGPHHLLRLERRGVAAHDLKMTSTDPQAPEHAVDLRQGLGQHVIVHAARRVQDHGDLGEWLAQAGQDHVTPDRGPPRGLAIAEVDAPGHVGHAAADGGGQQVLPTHRGSRISAAQRRHPAGVVP